MAEPLKVRLFGSPQFEWAGAPVPCPSKKALALMAFLLVTAKPHPRQQLAALLWGRRDDEAARTSLRVALHRLPAPLAGSLDIGRDTVGLSPSAGAIVDLQRFESLSTASDLATLEAAAALYRDHLLPDFDASATAEFDDWLHAQRTRLGQRAQSVFESVVALRAHRAREDAARAAEDRASALATAARWATLMPGAESAHRWLMQLYLDLGQRDAALAQYDLCRRQLAIANGRAPSAELRALHERAITGIEPAGRQEAQGDFKAQIPKAAPYPVHSAEPIPATSFVGRIEELAELEGLLTDPACRLITLHGLGGAGKTRLAEAFANQAGRRFADGTWWIALEYLDSAAALPRAIAEALGRDLPAQGDHATAIIDALARKQALVVLDNFETLLHAQAPDALDPVAFVLRLLQRAPQLRVLVTSREVLGVQEEWVFELAGLASAAEGPLPTRASGEPAVELFAQRARQSYLGFSLSAELPHVRRICRLVDGLPLGIELAAAWVRTVPCAELSDAIATAAGKLASRHRNRPQRHQSLEAVVAFSCDLLAVEQQQALAALGAFCGAFTRDAADHVAGASLRTLSALTDRSLVRRRSEGRYDLHPLVRQFAMARLKADRTRYRSVARLHREYFADALADLRARLSGPDEVAADADLRSDFPDLLAAWRAALEGGATALVERMAASMFEVLLTRGRVAEALAEGERAVDMLDGRDSAYAILARMQWGRAAIFGGQPQVARRELERAVALAREGDRRDVAGRCLCVLAALEHQQGNLDAAEAAADEALALAGDTDDAELRMRIYNTYGTLAGLRTRFDLAETQLRRSLEAAREVGAPSSIAALLCSLGVPLYYQGKFDDAAATHLEAAGLFQTLGKHVTALMVRSNLAAIRIAQGNLTAARAELDAVVRLSRESGNDDQLASSLVTLGDVLLRQREPGPARAALDEGLRLAEQMHRQLTTTEALFLLATIDISAGNRGPALRHLLRLRDLLATNRLDVRVPMLVMGVADWILTATASGSGEAERARAWLQTLASRGDVDATLRDKARAMLTAQAAASPGATGEAASRELREVEAEVLAFLDAVPVTDQPT